MRHQLWVPRMSDFISALDHEITDLERALQAHPAFIKLQHLRSVRDLYAKRDDQGANTAKVAPTAFRDEAPTTRRLPTTGVSVAILDAVREFLRDREYPTPTREIMAMLDRSGIRIGGTNPQNSVSSLMSKAPEILSRGRSGWVLKNTNSAGGVLPGSVSPPADEQPGAQGREAGPGGGT